ncbi:hypothetical protein ACGFI9_03280 [Micromonospora sp. NPDC048930]|uniref:hypothetical protein n=1 Tax=Micromonospora sp. NPDC048930 TaxID=3364261 RepID=UPI00371F67FA
MSVPPAVARLAARATRPPVTVGSPLAAHLDDAGTALPATAVPPVPHPTSPAPPTRPAPPAWPTGDGQPIERPPSSPAGSIAPQPEPAAPASSPAGRPLPAVPASSRAGRPLPAVPVAVSTPDAPARVATGPVGPARTGPVVGSDVAAVPAAPATGVPVRPAARAAAPDGERHRAAVPAAALPATPVGTPEAGTAWPDQTTSPPVLATPGPGAADSPAPAAGAPAPGNAAQPAPVPPVQIGRIEIQVAPPPAETDPFRGCRALEGGVTARRGGGW